MPPAYWPRACTALCNADPVMAAIIHTHRKSALISRGDPFTTLARAIVGQQISVKAAASVWARLQTAIDPFTPEAIAARAPAEFAGLGLSARKVEYLLALATRFAQQPLLCDALAAMDDAQVIQELTAIRGIGPWTAEMALIFTFLRPDVLPVSDLGLMRAISLHYRNGQPVTAQQALRIGTRWSPWRSVATWYLWRSLDPEPVEY